MAKSPAFLIKRVLGLGRPPTHSEAFEVVRNLAAMVDNNEMPVNKNTVEWKLYRALVNQGWMEDVL